VPRREEAARGSPLGTPQFWGCRHCAGAGASV